jgi:hypothetical protein
LLEQRTLPSAAILGSVWNDVNGDAVHQPAEPGLPGVVAYLDLNHNRTFDSHAVDAAPSSLALGPAPGGFPAQASFINVAGLDAPIQGVTVHLDVSLSSPGPVEVDLISPRFDNVNVTAPSILMFLEQGDSFSGTFDENAANPVSTGSSPFSGAYRPETPFSSPLSHVFDGAANGTWGLMFQGDVSGLSLNGWSLTFTEPEPNVVTDANGSYAFTGLAPGAYSVGVVLPPAAKATSPGQGVTLNPINVSGDDVVSGVDFGLQPAPDLVGTSFQVVESSPNWGDEVTVNYTLANQGGSDAGPFAVNFTLFDSSQPVRHHDVLQTVSIDHGLARGATLQGLVKLQLPGTPGQPPAGFSYPYEAFLGLQIDPNHQVAESDVTNNGETTLGKDMATLQQLPNEAVTDDAGVQQMPSIAVDPHDAQHIVIAYMDYSLLSSGYAGIGSAVSHDGGATWQRHTVPLPAGFDRAAGQPTVQFDDQGHVFVSYMAATFLGAVKPPLYYDTGRTNGIRNRALAMSSNNGIFVARSDDGGATWDAPAAVVTHTFAGSKVPFDALPDLAVDTFPQLANGQPNPNYGNLYATWTRFYPKGQFPGQPNAPGGSDVMFAVSHDGGQTWQTEVQDNNGVTESIIKDPLYGELAAVSEGAGFSVSSHVSVGAGGEIFVSMYSGGLFTVFHSSTGGVSFVSPDPTLTHGYPFGGLTALPTPTLFNDAFRTLQVRDIVADPLRPGHVYVVESIQVKDQNGTPIDAGDIYFARSDDYGTTWQTIFTVGANPLNFGEVPGPGQSSYLSALNDDDGSRYLGFSTQLQNEVISGQALPHMSVDAQGNITVIWYDTRRDPAGALLDVFGTASSDGGKHFSANYRITDTTFDPNAGSFTGATGHPSFYIGDLIGLATANGTGFATWTDTRNGNQDIRFARFPIAPLPEPLGDRFEPNNSPEQATDLGQVFAQQIQPRLTVGAGDEDWYRLTTTAKGDLIVTASNPAGGQALTVELWDATGTTLLESGTSFVDATGLVFGQQVVHASDSGVTYLVHVSAANSTPVEYSLSVQSLTKDLGSQVYGLESGTLSEGGNAVYRLVAGVPGTLLVQLTAGALMSSDSSQPANISVKVLSADGLTVLGTGTLLPPGNPGPGSIAQIQLPVDQGETVLIQVTADATTQGDFQLEFTNFDQFETSQPASLFFPTAGNPSAVALADVNGDHRPDLIVTSNKFADTVSVLLSNGDGTFQAPREYAVGAGQDARFVRELAVSDVTGDGIPDIVVSNHNSSDVSVLVGRGDGTFAPQRRSDATSQPASLGVADFNGDGIPDVVTLDTLNHEPATGDVGVMLGRGDGTFAPPLKVPIPFQTFTYPVRIGDFNGDGRPDLVVFGLNEAKCEVLLGKGDGTFTPGGIFDTGEVSFDAQVADLKHDGKLDLIVTGANTGNLYVLMGNGDGTFQKPEPVVVSQPKPGDNIAVASVAVADINGDGKPDLVVTAQSRAGGDLAQVILLPGVFATDSSGNYVLFGTPQVLAYTKTAGHIAVADLTGNGAQDIVVTDVGGVRVIYGKPPQIAPNTSMASARDLGTVVHLVNPPQAIVPGHEDAFYTLKVPTEAFAVAGPEVLDISAQFQDLVGAGLGMEVRDAQGNLLGSGDRLRLTVAQGATLSVHVFGVTANDGSRGSGSYVLDFDVLPQLASVEAPSLWPGENGQPGGPVTSLVLTFQGDRLDPAAATDPANYRVLFLGADGQSDLAQGQAMALATAPGSPPIIWDGGANVQASSGRTFPTAVRQTVTLLFDHPLPAGSYMIEVSDKLQTAAFSATEGASLAVSNSFSGHPLVTHVNGNVVAGSQLTVSGLVKPASPLGSFATFAQGTSFLTQLQNDLGALLDSTLTSKGDDPGLTALLIQHIRKVLLPSLGDTASRPAPVAVVFLDPVSIDLKSPEGNRTTYNRQSGKESSDAPNTFVEVGGNVEVLVMADVAGTFRLSVGDVPDTARGGIVVFNQVGDDFVLSLTDGMRGGDTEFQFVVAGLPGAEATSTNSDSSAASASLATALAALLTPVIVAPAGEPATGTEATGGTVGASSLTVADLSSALAGVVSPGEGSPTEVGLHLRGQIKAFVDRASQLWLPALMRLGKASADLGKELARPLGPVLRGVEGLLDAAGLLVPDAWRLMFRDLGQPCAEVLETVAGQWLQRQLAKGEPAERVAPALQEEPVVESEDNDESPAAEGCFFDPPLAVADAYWAAAFFVSGMMWSAGREELPVDESTSPKLRVARHV